MFERILIVGYGSIAERHLKIIRNLYPKADIKILRHKPHTCAPEQSNGCFFDIESAVKFMPQISVITGPSSLHIEIAKNLAPTGTHFFIEKPISNSFKEAQFFNEQVISNQQRVFVAYNLRFFESLKLIKKMLQQKSLGKIYSFHCEVGQYLPEWRPNKDYRETVSAINKLGGGVLLELSHELDYLSWLFGDLISGFSFVNKLSDLDIDVEDSVHLLLEFLSTESHSSIIGSVKLDFIRKDKARNLEIIGSITSLKWDALLGHVQVFDPAKKEWNLVGEFEDEMNTSYLKEWEYFINIISNETNETNTKDALNVLRYIDLIKKNLNLGKIKFN